MLKVEKSSTTFKVRLILIDVWFTCMSLVSIHVPKGSARHYLDAVCTSCRPLSILPRLRALGGNAENPAKIATKKTPWILEHPS